MITDELKTELINILQEELIPAMGCTEPIALAYAAATARKYCKLLPDSVVAYCSGNMIKNVRCVTIPNAEGMVGIEVATVLGMIGGDAGRIMEVLEAVTPEDVEATRAYIKAGKCRVEYLDSEIPLHFVIEAKAGSDTVRVEVRNGHTHIVSVMVNDVEQLESASGENDTEDADVTTDRSVLSIETIKEFADTVPVADIKALYDKQIRCNMDIAYEGISGEYGLNLGRTIREQYPDGVVTRMKAYAAAASEARMSGCDMPVIITSGSGNQGIASSVPVIIYARENNIPQEKLYRSLCFSSLLTIYQKEFIGKLSAFCGAVSASCAAGAAITYLCGGSIKQITDTIDNTLANIPGIICDGAKISCAAKIASSIDAAMMAHFLAMRNKAYEAYTGILKEDAGETISCVGYIGKVGMRQTDKEIINMMLKS